MQSEKPKRGSAGYKAWCSREWRRRLDSTPEGRERRLAEKRQYEARRRQLPEVREKLRKKALARYHKSKASVPGFLEQHAKKVRAYVEQNRELINERGRLWYRKNAEKCKEGSRTRSAQLRPPRMLALLSAASQLGSAGVGDAK